MLSRNSDVDTVVLKDKAQVTAGMLRRLIRGSCRDMYKTENCRKIHRLKKMSDIRHIVGLYPL